MPVQSILLVRRLVRLCPSSAQVLDLPPQRVAVSEENGAKAANTQASAMATMWARVSSERQPSGQEDRAPGSG